MGKAVLIILSLLVVYTNDAVLASNDAPTANDDDDDEGIFGGIPDVKQPPSPQEDPSVQGDSDEAVFQAPSAGCPWTNCTDASEPVCATNSLTYENLCLLEEARACGRMPSLTLNHTGECHGGPADFFNYKMRVDDDEIATFSMANIPIDETKYRRRQGISPETHECYRVQRRVPSHLTFITRFRHYSKYTHAYGIPVISTAAVKDATIKRACYVLQFLLADRKRLRQSLFKNYGRVGVIGTYEHTTSIPEHSWLGASWNQRARGLGGTLRQPISTGTEENIMCDQRKDRYRDRYPTEDIFLHEFSHGIQEVAIRGGGIPGYFKRLERAYYYARSRGLWRNTYAMSTVQEYFAEGTQSFFNVNTYSPRANGVHGPISTRKELARYDPTLYALVKEVFPCMNTFWKRCDAALRGTKMPAFQMNCDGDGTRKWITAGGTKPVKPVKPTKKPPQPTQPPKPPQPEVYKCTDKNRYCKSWAKGGFCTKGTYIKFMMTSCRTSCGCCTDRNTNCERWKGKQYCNHAVHSRYMNTYCKKSCKTCQTLENRN